MDPMQTPVSSSVPQPPTQLPVPATPVMPAAQATSPVSQGISTPVQPSIPFVPSASLTPTPVSTDPVVYQSDPAAAVQSPSINAVPDIQAPALAEPLVQAATQVHPVQPVSMGAGRKEAAASQEVGTVIEVVGQDAIETEPLPAEVESWMEKVGGAREMPPAAEVSVTLPQPPVTPVPSVPPKPVFVVPLGKSEYQAGLHASVQDSVRWLSTWCKRVIKQFGTQVVFKQ